MRRVLLLCALLMLAACNRVQTTAPMFSAEDALGAPPLRNGVWLIESESAFSVFQWSTTSKKPCEPDLRQPAYRWRDCARWFVVRDGQMLTLVQDGPDKRAWIAHPFLVANGDPPVIQFRDFDEASNPELYARDREEAAGRGEAYELEESDYVYFGAEVGARDADGRVVAFRAWPALCGPHPDLSDRKPKEPPNYLTRDPLPGVTLEGQGCRTDSKAVLLESIRRSREWEGDPVRLRWIREGL